MFILPIIPYFHVDLFSSSWRISLNIYWIEEVLLINSFCFSLSSKKYISFSDVSLSELTLNDLWKRLNWFLTLIEKREKKRGTINIIRLESYYHWLHTGVWSYQLEKNYSSLANRVKSLFPSAAPDWLIPAYSELRGNKNSLCGLSLCEN